MPKLQFLVNDFTSEPHLAHRDGREYLVAPVVMAREGVLSGNHGAIFYPAKQLRTKTQRWDGVPITLDHPEDSEGNKISAQEGGRHIGMVRNTTYRDGLRAEAWFDTAKTPASILRKVKEGRRIEVSTGLFTETRKTGGQWRGETYSRVLESFEPDHLAIITRGVGACSFNDGCGVRVTSNRVAANRIGFQVPGQPACSCGCGCGHNAGIDIPTANSRIEPLGLPVLFPDGNTTTANSATMELPDSP